MDAEGCKDEVSASIQKEEAVLPPFKWNKQHIMELAHAVTDARMIAGFSRVQLAAAISPHSHVLPHKIAEFEKLGTGLNIDHLKQIPLVLGYGSMHEMITRTQEIAALPSIRDAVEAGFVLPEVPAPGSIVPPTPRRPRVAEMLVKQKTTPFAPPEAIERQSWMGWLDNQSQQSSRERK